MANITTRAKFYVESVTKRQSHSGTVILRAVHDSAINTEDHAFQKATPSGTLEMSLYGEKQMEFFKPGQKFYIDFTEVE